jgi:hypothetical protein
MGIIFCVEGYLIIKTVPHDQKDSIDSEEYRIDNLSKQSLQNPTLEVSFNLKRINSQPSYLDGAEAEAHSDTDIDWRL